jgi:hypothetical protein
LLHWLHFGYKPCKIHDGLLLHTYFSMNFIAIGIINFWTHYNSLCGDKNKYKVINYVKFYKATVNVMLHRMCRLFPYRITWVLIRLRNVNIVWWYIHSYMWHITRATGYKHPRLSLPLSYISCLK